MAVEAGLVGMVVGASAAGAFGEAMDDLEYAARKFQIDQATGSGSTDVHVRMEHLVDFYNALADIHEELNHQRTQVKASAESFGDMAAGGHVAGVKKAWAEMTAAAGARGSMASMAAGLRDLDVQVLRLMDSLHDNATKYAANEEYALTSIGKAAGTGGKHHGKSGSKHHGKQHGKSGESKGHGKGEAKGEAKGAKVSTDEAWVEAPADRSQQVVGFGGR